MTIRNLIALLSIPIVLAFVPHENQQFWFFVSDSQTYAERVVYADSDSSWVISKNVGDNHAIIVEGSYCPIYYHELRTQQFVKLDSTNQVYGHTLALLRRAVRDGDRSLIQIGSAAPIHPNTLKMLTPLEEEAGLYFTLLILILVAALVYVVAMFDYKTKY